MSELTDIEQRQLRGLMDAFRESITEAIYHGEDLLKMCNGCAFKKGTEAISSPHTVLAAIECVMKDEPFFCHKHFTHSGKNMLCNGWINIMNNK